MNKFTGVTAVLTLQKKEPSINSDYYIFGELISSYKSVIYDNINSSKYTLLNKLNMFYITLKDDYSTCRDLFSPNSENITYPSMLSATFENITYNTVDFLRVKFDLTSSYISHDCDLIVNIINNYQAQPLPENWDYLLAGTSNYSLFFEDGEFTHISTVCDMRLRTLKNLEASLNNASSLNVKHPLNETGKEDIYEYCTYEGTFTILIHKDEKEERGWIEILYSEPLEIESQVQPF